MKHKITVIISKKVQRKRKGVTPVLCGDGGLWRGRVFDNSLRANSGLGLLISAAPLLYFSSDVAQFSTSITPSLASVPQAKCVCFGVELPLSGPPRQARCHLFKPEVSQRQNGFQAPN